VDKEILDVLTDIRISVYVLIVATIIVVALSLFRVFSSSRWVLREATERVFRVTAEEFFEKGEYNKLIKHCDDVLKNRPNHLYALWYLGKAHYALKDYRAAAIPFERLVEIQPDWEEGYVRIYLDKIRQTGDEPRVH
jgi:cytochrome c-type biogenesis protein CcmH/NrfG